ncbi:Conserved_hypothetical protein [Hexamita inflata]|uniref:Uncharacterized protein n=1 Tax=Hexamita inflata TaxID=28002 RepID=A0AA86PAM8_9EUKA|nr:Conserved hypothetical protein [Hexamita inflata]
MEKISTPAAKLSQLQILGKPAIDPQDYPKCPAQPLVVYKLALQMVFEAGFDSTSKLQRASKEEQEKPKTQATDFQKKLQQIASTLTQKCSLDLKLAEELVNPIDPDSMDDANYVKMHVLMETLEQLNDHNDVTVEYPLYDNVKKYGLDVSLEDQPVTTFSPVQVYLAPFDQRVLCPYLNARFSSVDYCFPDLPRKLQSCVFINDYNKVKDPNNTQKLYLSSVIQTTGEALPQDFIHRQLSAHEMWVNLISQRQNFPLQCSIADSYCAVIENTSHELNQMLNQLQDVEQDTMLQKLQIYQKQPLKQSNTNYDKFIEQIIANVINQSPIKSEPLNPPTGRNYQFKSDFDVSLRGMMEQKSTAHHFYQFETNKKIAFLQPILAQKILQYTKMGEFSKFINQELVIPHDQVENTLVFEDSSDSMKESVKAPETKVQSELMVTVGKLTQEFCDIILKQHQELLKVILQSQQSVTYVESQFQTQDQNDFDDLLIRPVCGCYTCNLCSLSETFEFTEKIFPLLKLRKPRHLVLDENEAPSDFYVSQKEFVEKVLGLDYTHDFTKMVPYFPTFCKKLKQDLNLDLGQLQVQPDPSSNRKSKKKTPKQKKLSPDFLFQQILFFCACAPQFLQYPASYGAQSTEFPSIVLSQQFRVNKQFDPRSELLLAFLRNPASGNLQMVQQDEVPEVVEKENLYRTIFITQNSSIKRYMAQFYKEKYIEPENKDIWDLTSLELANLMFNKQEIESVTPENYYSQDVNLCQDFRAVTGLMVAIKNLPSLPIVKKYHGVATVQPQKSKKPFAIFKCKVLGKKQTLSDQAFISKLYKCLGDGDGKHCTGKVEVDREDEVSDDELYSAEEEALNEQNEENEEEEIQEE